MLKHLISKNAQHANKHLIVLTHQSFCEQASTEPSPPEPIPINKKQKAPPTKKWQRFFKGNERPLIDVHRSIKGELEITTNIASFLFFQQQRFTIQELISCIEQFKVDGLKLNIEQELLYKTFLLTMNKSDSAKLRGFDFQFYQSLKQSPHQPIHWLPLLMSADTLVLYKSSYLSKLVLNHLHHLFPTLTFPQQVAYQLLSLSQDLIDPDHLSILLSTIQQPNYHSLIEDLSLYDQKRLLNLCHKIRLLYPSSEPINPQFIWHLTQFYLSSIKSSSPSTTTNNGLYLDSLASPVFQHLSPSLHPQYLSLLITKITTQLNPSLSFPQSQSDLDLLIPSPDLLSLFPSHQPQTLLSLVNHLTHLTPHNRIPSDIESFHSFSSSNLSSSLILSILQSNLQSLLETRVKPKIFKPSGFEPTSELLSKTQQLNLLFQMNFTTLPNQLNHPFITHKVTLILSLISSFLSTLLNHLNTIYRKPHFQQIIHSMVIGSSHTINPDLYQASTLDYFTPAFLERFGNNADLKQPDYLTRIKVSLQQLMTKNDDLCSSIIDNKFINISNQSRPYHRSTIRTLYIHQQILELLANYASSLAFSQSLLGQVKDTINYLDTFHTNYLKQMPFFPQLFISIYKLYCYDPNLLSKPMVTEIIRLQEYYQSLWGNISEASQLLDWIDQYCNTHHLSIVNKDEILSSTGIHMAINKYDHAYTVSQEQVHMRQKILKSKDPNIKMIERQDLIQTQFNDNNKANLVNYLLDQPWTQVIINESILKKQIEVVLADSPNITFTKNHLEFPFFADFIIETQETKLAIIVMEKDKVIKSSPYINNGYYRDCANYFKNQKGYKINRVYYDDFNIDPKYFLQNILNNRKKNLQREDQNEVSIQKFDEELLQKIKDDHVKSQKNIKLQQIELSEEVQNIIEFQ